MFPTRTSFQHRSATPAEPVTPTITACSTLDQAYTYAPMAPPTTPMFADTSASIHADYGANSTMIDHSSTATIPLYTSQDLGNYSFDIMSPVFAPFSSQATSSIEFKPPSVTSDTDDFISSASLCPHIPPICIEHPFGCPRDSSLNDYTHQRMIDIMIERGRNRFPPFAHDFLASNLGYDPRNIAMGPGTFPTEELRALYAREPIYLQVPQSAMKRESKYQGIMYRLNTEDIFRKMFQHETIKRGTVIILNNLNSKYARYVVTIRRFLNDTISLVQLNAYIWNNSHLAYNNLDWPTLLLTVPNLNCNVPMPDSILPYYAQYLTIAPPGYPHPHINTTSTAPKRKRKAMLASTPPPQ